VFNFLGRQVEVAEPTSSLQLLKPTLDMNPGAKTLSRREMLRSCSTGFGALALSALLADPAFGGKARTATDPRRPLAPRSPHRPSRARNVIFLYMEGGVSQVDSFDYKPLLSQYHGRSPQEVIGELEATQFQEVGGILKSPWNFRRYGQSGTWVSDLFPHIAQQIDDVCVIRSLTSQFPEHTSANYFLHTGVGIQGRPSLGAWSVYGLGSENQNLPGFVVLNGGLIPSGGIDCFTNGFLPASYQGSLFQAKDPPVANIRPNQRLPRLQPVKRALVRRLDQLSLQQTGKVDALESAIANYELAARMQIEVPDLMDISRESQPVRRTYGLEAAFEPTRQFGLQCLIARRLVERGVRFVELTCPSISGISRWDAHDQLRKNHSRNALATDQPIAALLMDLKRCGLLEETLVVWSGEFGRTPFAQKEDGRDHNEFGFSMWMAGGGVQGGLTYGKTDEWGYKAVENRLEMYDLHATILHLLGLDHTRLTYRFGGRDMRLTDVYGKVVEDILSSG
jgi:hypothetical protein